MDTVRTIVRNIAIVILLASFLELLLPNNSMRRFVQLVMGLFVLMAVLGPVVKLLDRPLSFEIPAWSETGAGSDQELAQVLQQGQSLKDKSKQAAMDGLKQALEQQAKALALTVQGVKEVSLQANLKQSGEVESLEVYVGAPGSDIQPVQPVDGLGKSIQAARPLSPEEQRISKDLQSRLGTLLGIAAEKVLVHFRAGQ